MEAVPNIIIVKKHGNSLTIIIPPEVSKRFSVKEGDFFLPFFDEVKQKDTKKSNGKQLELLLKFKKKGELQDLPYLYFFGDNNE